MRKTAIAFAAAVFAVLAGMSQAAVVGLQAEGGTGPKSVYRLANGNFLGLWGFDNRNPGAGAVTLASENDILSGFQGDRRRIVGFYNGRTVVNPGKSEFDRITWGFTIPDEARLSNSLWIEWTGVALVFRGPVGGTRNMQPSATLEGDPLLPAVPVPASLPLLLAGLGALGLLSRPRPTR